MKTLAQNSMIQNRYLIVQMIGKGGMGEVYLAVDQRLGSAVALKRTIFVENTELASAFEREAKILGRLRHPVLPKVIDHFTEGADQFLIMEHISGEDLGKRLESAGKPFPLSWVMFWADQLLDALNYLHSHEPPIIHRDIKPENLKLTDDNHIVLLDFGLSKDFDSKAESTSLGTGSLVGYSPYFASMEQVRGTGTDARSDIYSFSATIYQMLTNVMPPDSLTRADALLGGAEDPVRPVSSINPEVSKAISDVILKGMSVRQDARYRSAVEMQRELRRAVNSKDEPQAPSLPAGAETQMMSAPTEVMTRGEMTEPLPMSFSNAPTAIDIEAADMTTQVMMNPLPGEELEPEIPHTAAAAAAAGADAAGISAAKKNGKGGLILGGLFGLLLLAGIAAGGGWFAYTKYYLPSQIQPAPTPVAELVTPTPEPTPEATEAPVVAEANTNSDIEPTNAEISQSNSNANGAKVPALRNTNPADTRTSQTSPVTRATPRTPQTPAVKPTPKPKTGGDRTVILQ
jgi:serine/threonine protein kinase